MYTHKASTFLHSHIPQYACFIAESRIFFKGVEVSSSPPVVNPYSTTDIAGINAGDTFERKFDTKEKLGKRLFFDKNLSLTRNTSCATCHNPEHGFVDARFKDVGVDQAIFIDGALSVGDDGFSLGGRNAPTAAYAQFSPTFDPATLKGGQFHDGRAATLKVQAMGPPLDGAEMQMPNKASVVERIKENPDYVLAFKTLFNDKIFDDINASYAAMGEAIGKFEKTDLFAPFDSKYDRFKKCKEEFTTNECIDKVGWTDSEDNGMSLFFSNANTNCALCHTLNSKTEAGEKEIFTNFEYENIGTPRNVLAMDARAALGLQDADAKFDGVGKTVGKSEHLGKTKVPTLRNIAVTGPYMNNGVFKDLTTVLEFYDHMAGLGHHINPETNQPWGQNDHISTINHEKLTTTKALTDAKIRDLEAFLNTLTDRRYEHLLKK